MSRSLQSVKENLEVIVKVSKVNDKLLFYSANNLNVPMKAISTKNLKSIVVYTDPITRFTDTGYYTTNFEYQTNNVREQVRWMYAFDIYNWESETAELINKTIELA